MYAPKHMAIEKAPSRRSRVRWTVAFVIWLCVVWGHSLMGGDLSSLESSRFVFLVRPIFALFGNHDEQLMTFVIRKGAHFTEYAILGGLALGMARSWLRGAGAWALTLAIWVAAPCIDELIQRFVPGRNGNPRDVLIDMAGGLLGVVVARGVLGRRQKE